MNEDLISRSALREKLQAHHDFFVNAWGGFSNLPTKDKARVDEITNCIAEVMNAPAVDAGPKWISVKDKLPERYKRVLVAFKGGMVTTSMRTFEQYTGVLGFLFEGDYGTATHWMPLPEPPEEDDKNE